MMTPFRRLTLFAVLIGFLAIPVQAQTIIDSTTLSTELTVSAQTVTVASVTCTGCTINGNTVLFIDFEALCVNGTYSSGTTLPVTRGCLGTKAARHSTSVGGVSKVVYLGPAARFHGGAQTGVPGAGDPPLGHCLRSENQFLPWINVSNGVVWMCDNYDWRALINYNQNGTAPSR